MESFKCSEQMGKLTVHHIFEYTMHDCLFITILPNDQEYPYPNIARSKNVSLKSVIAVYRGPGREPGSPGERRMFACVTAQHWSRADAAAPPPPPLLFTAGFRRTQPGSRHKQTAREAPDKQCGAARSMVIGNRHA